MSGQPTNPQYVLRFFFDAGSGICFRPGNDAASLRFDYPVYVEKLPLTAPIRLYDESFNWKSPLDPGPWTPDQQREFNSRVVQTPRSAIEELGPDFQVVDEFSPRLK